MTRVSYFWVASVYSLACSIVLPENARLARNYCTTRNQRFDWLVQILLNCDWLKIMSSKESQIEGLCGCVLAFFEIEEAASVTWAHAVNSKLGLEAALADEGVMMLEADVVMGCCGVPIMAHPPNTRSDVTLEEWVDTIIQSQLTGKCGRKGMKIDLKDLSVVEPCVRMLCLKKAMLVKTQLPLWMNADVLLGPDGRHLHPLDPMIFFAQCEELNFIPSVVMSLGWTTGSRSMCGYSAAMVDEMLELIRGR